MRRIVGIFVVLLVPILYACLSIPRALNCNLNNVVLTAVLNVHQQIYFNCVQLCCYCTCA